jgi:hypothetical protein
MTTTLMPNDDWIARRFSEIVNFPTRKAADDFFKGKLDWKSLPERLDKLVGFLNEWVRDA